MAAADRANLLAIKSSRVLSAISAVLSAMVTRKIEEELGVLAAKHAGETLGETALKQLAFDSVIIRLGYGYTQWT